MKKHARAKKKILSTSRVWMIFAAVATLATLSLYVVVQGARSKEVVSDIPPEIESATLMEALFQMRPEELPTKDSVKIPIFIYHSIRPIDPNDSSAVKTYEISPELFEEQLKYLRDNGYTTVSLDDVVDDIKIHSTGSVKKPVVLTFDDGWENQYKYAFPLLKKYHMTGTFYVYTNPISKVDHWLTWDQLKEMQAAGMTIEDHTLSHPLFKHTSTDQIKTEVTQSKKILEQHLGTHVDHFASPYGYWTESIADIVRGAGYATYRTTYKGVYQDNPMRLRGILVTNDLNYFIEMLNR